MYRFLKDYITDEDKLLDVKDLITKYLSEITDLSKMEKDTEIFGHYNAWWVFGEVAKEMEIDYDIFMAVAENVGYKRTKRGENPRPNDLYDVEYAPKHLDCEKILEGYNNRIIAFKEDQKVLEIKLKTLKKKLSQLLLNHQIK